MRIEMDGSGAAASPPPPAKSPARTLDTSPAKAWTDAVAQAKANAPQPSVKAKPGDTLTSIATSHQDTVQDVEKANPQIACPNLIHAGETVYLPKTTPAQVVTGVDNAQIKPIVAAMADANSADQGLQQLEKAPYRNRAILQDAQAQSAQSWDTVEQTTYNMLVNNNGSAYPEQAAAEEVKQLNALEPGNAKFAAANNAALADATHQWQQMGVTKPQLSPIIDAYNNVTQTTNAVNQYLQDPHVSHNRAIVQDLLDSEQQAKSQLNTAIEKSLTDAANQAGTNPKARSEAMTERAMNIQLAGPQDQAFQTAVDNANYDLQVTKPAETVAAAYTKGGAEEAAKALKTVTQNAGNAYYASQIIQASQGTIDSITKELGSLASSEPRPSRADAYKMGPSPAEAEFYQIYSDLSQAVGAAGPIAISRTPDGQASASLSPYEKEAADVVANSIAKNAPNNMMPWQGLLYSSAASQAITSGDGPAMTLATAAAAKSQGNGGLAPFIVRGVTGGIQALQSQTSDDVTSFATTTNNLHKLRATWGPFMSESQLVNATNGYLADHQDIRTKADAQLAVISKDGDAVAEVEAAWQGYGAGLNGVDGQGDLSAAAKSLTGNNGATAFAVSQSTTLNNAIAAAFGPSTPGSSSGAGSVVQALIASPAWSLPKSTRSFVNAFFKAHNAQAKTAGASPRWSQGTFTTLSFIGLGLTAETAWAKGFSASTPEALANSVYTALGFGKYTGEVISGLAKTSIIQNLVKNNSAFSFVAGATADKNKLFLNLPNGQQLDLTGLTKTGWFKALGSAYYGAGALASFLEASDEFSNGDNIAGGFDIAEAVGNGLNAAKPLIEEAFGEVAGEAAGAIGSGIGVVAVIGTLIYQGIKSAQEQQAYRDDSSKFLQQGLGLKPDIANALSGPSGQSDGSSASAALQAYASAYHMTPGQLLQKLNQEPTDKVKQFINEAANIPTQSNGGYATSLPTDDPHQTGNHLVWRAAGRAAVEESVPYQADSLRQLKYWADYLFGKDQVG
jgi:LysM domain